MPSPVSFRGIVFKFTNSDEVLQNIDAATHTKPLRIATVNPEFIEEAVHNSTFKQVLERMTHCTIDGSGLLFFLKLQRTKILKPQLYHGSDMVNDLFKRYQNGQKSFFLLGGQPGVMEAVSNALKTTYPHLNIAGSSDGGIISSSNITVDPALIGTIQAAQADILLVAFGSPKQELWIDVARHHLQVPVMIGIGGSLDFYVTKKRAPKILRTLHFEWLYRTFTERGHAKRAFRAIIVFSLSSLWWMLTHPLA